MAQNNKSFSFLSDFSSFAAPLIESVAADGSFILLTSKETVSMFHRHLNGFYALGVDSKTSIEVLSSLLEWRNHQLAAARAMRDAQCVTSRQSRFSIVSKISESGANFAGKILGKHSSSSSNNKDSNENSSKGKENNNGKDKRIKSKISLDIDACSTNGNASIIPESLQLQHSRLLLAVQWLFVCVVAAIARSCRYDADGEKKKESKHTNRVGIDSENQSISGNIGKTEKSESFEISGKSKIDTESATDTLNELCDIAHQFYTDRSKDISLVLSSNSSVDFSNYFDYQNFEKTLFSLSSFPSSCSSTTQEEIEKHLVAEIDKVWSTIFGSYFFSFGFGEKICKMFFPSEILLKKTKRKSQIKKKGKNIEASIVLSRLCALRSIHLPFSIPNIITNTEEKKIVLKRSIFWVDSIFKSLQFVEKNGKTLGWSKGQRQRIQLGISRISGIILQSMSQWNWNFNFNDPTVKGIVTNWDDVLKVHLKKVTDLATASTTEKKYAATYWLCATSFMCSSVRYHSWVSNVSNLLGELCIRYEKNNNQYFPEISINCVTNLIEELLKRERQKLYYEKKSILFLKILKPIIDKFLFARQSSKDKEARRRCLHSIVLKNQYLRKDNCGLQRLIEKIAVEKFDTAMQKIVLPLMRSISNDIFSVQSLFALQCFERILFVKIEEIILKYEKIEKLKTLKNFGEKIEKYQNQKPFCQDNEKSSFLKFYWNDITVVLRTVMKACINVRANTSLGKEPNVPSGILSTFENKKMKVVPRKIALQLVRIFALIWPKEIVRSELISLLGSFAIQWHPRLCGNYNLNSGRSSFDSIVEKRLRSLDLHFFEEKNELYSSFLQYGTMCELSISATIVMKSIVRIDTSSLADYACIVGDFVTVESNFSNFSRERKIEKCYSLELLVSLLLHLKEMDTNLINLNCTVELESLSLLLLCDANGESRYNAMKLLEALQDLQKNQDQLSLASIISQQGELWSVAANATSDESEAASTLSHAATLFRLENNVNDASWKSALAAKDNDLFGHDRWSRIFAFVLSRVRMTHSKAIMEACDGASRLVRALQGICFSQKNKNLNLKERKKVMNDKELGENASKQSQNTENDLVEMPSRESIQWRNLMVLLCSFSDLNNTEISKKIISQVLRGLHSPFPYIRNTASIALRHIPQNYSSLFLDSIWSYETDIFAAITKGKSKNSNDISNNAWYVSGKKKKENKKLQQTRQKQRLVLLGLVRVFASFSASITEPEWCNQSKQSERSNIHFSSMNDSTRNRMVAFALNLHDLLEKKLPHFVSSGFSTILQQEEMEVLVALQTECCWLFHHICSTWHDAFAAADATRVWVGLLQRWERSAEPLWYAADSSYARQSSHFSYPNFENFECSKNENSSFSSLQKSLLAAMSSLLRMDVKHPVPKIFSWIDGLYRCRLSDTSSTATVALLHLLRRDKCAREICVSRCYPCGGQNRWFRYYLRTLSEILIVLPEPPDIIGIVHLAITSAGDVSIAIRRSALRLLMRGGEENDKSGKIEKLYSDLWIAAAEAGTLLTTSGRGVGNSFLPECVAPDQKELSDVLSLEFEKAAIQNNNIIIMCRYVLEMKKRVLEESHSMQSRLLLCALPWAEKVKFKAEAKCSVKVKTLQNGLLNDLVELTIRIRKETDSNLLPLPETGIQLPPQLMQLWSSLGGSSYDNAHVITTFLSEKANLNLSSNEGKKKSEENKASENHSFKEIISSIQSILYCIVQSSSQSANAVFASFHRKESTSFSGDGLILLLPAALAGLQAHSRLPSSMSLCHNDEGKNLASLLHRCILELENKGPKSILVREAAKE